MHASTYYSMCGSSSAQLRRWEKKCEVCSLHNVCKAHHGNCRERKRERERDYE